jgi:hypothetical protein
LIKRILHFNPRSIVSQRGGQVELWWSKALAGSHSRMLAASQSKGLAASQSKGLAGSHSKGLALHQQCQRGRGWGCATKQGRGWQC